MAIGSRGCAAIIAVAALMGTGVACGNGAEPTSLNEDSNLPVRKQLMPQPKAFQQAATQSAESTPKRGSASLVQSCGKYHRIFIRPAN